MYVAMFVCLNFFQDFFKDEKQVLSKTCRRSVQCGGSLNQNNIFFHCQNVITGIVT